MKDSSDHTLIPGVFQAFHVDALREGRRSLNGRATLQAVVEDAMSRSDLQEDLAFLDVGSYQAAMGTPEK